MVTSIARQSVIIKCQQQTSILIGNYEMYYLAGLMKKIYGLDLDKTDAPKELFAKIQKALPKLKPSDEREGYLLKLIEFYKPLPEYDSQMAELFEWGANEKQLWEVHIS